MYAAHLTCKFSGSSYFLLKTGSTSRPACEVNIAVADQVASVAGKSCDPARRYGPASDHWRSRLRFSNYQERRVPHSPGLACAYRSTADQAPGCRVFRGCLWTPGEDGDSVSFGVLGLQRAGRQIVSGNQTSWMLHCESLHSSYLTESCREYYAYHILLQSQDNNELTCVPMRPTARA